MKEIVFNTSRVDGIENVMDIDATMKVKEIRLNQQSKQVTICYVNDEPTEAPDYASMPFGEVKALVEENGGKYTNKKDGVAFLNSL